MFESVSTRSGRLVPVAEGARAFDPAPLPPDLSLTAAQWRVLGQAEREIGRLQGLWEASPRREAVLRLAALQEATAAARVEGHTLSLADVAWWRLEAPQRLQPRAGLLRLTMQLADLLLDTGDEDTASLHERLYAELPSRERPGAPRRSLVWVGSRSSTLQMAPYVPPPPATLPSHLTDIERFRHQRDRWPAIVHGALLAYQTETVQPFLDGSSRVARALLLRSIGGAASREAAVLLRPTRQWLTDPVGLFRRQQQLREHGDFEAWIEFIARSLQTAAAAGIALLRGVEDWIRTTRSTVTALGTQRAAAEALIRSLPEQPIVDVRTVAARCQRNYANANILVSRLVELGILQEITGGQRHRRYLAHGLLERLDEQT